MSPSRARRIASFAAAAVVSASSLFSASATWLGTSSGNWSDAGNWSASPVPGTGDFATFSGAGNGNVIVSPGAVTVSEIIFDSGSAAAYQIGVSSGSGTITLNASVSTGTGQDIVINRGRIVVNPGVLNTQTINSNLVLGDEANAASAYYLSGGAINYGFNITGGITGNAVAGTKTLNLQGISGGSISGAISDGAGATAVTKNGASTWTLTGTNTFTGALTTNGGTLVLDYINSNGVVDYIIPAGKPLSINNSSVKVLGDTVGTTNQTLGNLSFSGIHNTLSASTNGGTATNLFLGNRIIRNGSLLTFDTSAGGNIFLTGTPEFQSGSVSTIASGTLINPVLTIRDGIGRGDFAVVDDVTTTKKIVRLNSSTPIPVSGAGTLTSHYLINADTTMLPPPETPAGTVFTFGATLRVDSSANPVRFNVGTNPLHFNNNAIVFEGSNDITVVSEVPVEGGDPQTQVSAINGRADGNLSLYVFSTGKVTIDTRIQTFSLIVQKLGPGLLDVTAPQNNNARDTRIWGGVYRSSNASGISTGTWSIANEAILELGEGMGTLTKPFSSNTGITNRIALEGSAGFSAHGVISETNPVVERIINNTVNPLIWGGVAGIGGFFSANPNAANKLIFSSPYANGRLIWQNPINFNGATRLIEVHNGSASVDATMSGILSSTDSLLAPTLGGFAKSGDGTLELTAQNTFTGTMTVAAGTVLVNNPDSATVGSVVAPVVVSSGAILGGTGSLLGNVTSAGTISPGVTVGTMTSGANFTLLPGSTTEFDVGAAGAGTGHDVLALTNAASTLTYGGTLRLLVGDLAGNGDYDLITMVGGLTRSGNFSAVNVITTAGTVPLANSGGIWSGQNASFAFSFDTATGRLTLGAPSALNPLETWRQTFFGTSSPVGNAANDADPDNDGTKNLVEYATGKNPTVAGPAPYVVGRNGAGRLTLTFDSIADSALTYTVQGSNDLVTWSTVFTASGATLGAQTNVIADTVLISAQPRRFLRLSVSR